jgi:gliding motility-associated-like protein
MKFRDIIFLQSLILFSFFSINRIHAQCNQNYNWTTWNSFSSNTANGSVLYNGQPIGVTMSSNFNFFSTGGIFSYGSFSGASSIPPNSTVPATTWSYGSGGLTTMCFSQQVENPVLLLSSVGSSGLPVTLKFSRPFIVVFDGGGNTFLNDSTLIGLEGYSIIKFLGNFDCVTIYSTTPENYTNITWGLNPPLFPVTITENYNACGSANYTASGGTTYSWSGGLTPNQATNTFNSSGTYFLTVTDQNGCQVNTSQQVTVNQNVTNLFPTDTISTCESSYTLDAGTGYASYQWNTGVTTQTINVTNSGLYHCTVSNGTCILADSVYVILHHVGAGNDTTICNGNSVQLNGSGGLIYSWTPTNGLNNPNIANPIATPQATTTYHLTSQVTMRNLIANPDFESGYNSFSSSYNPRPINQFEGEYVITNSPNAWNPGFNNCTDHTTGSGNMLLINGATTPNVTIYCQTVNVTPNTNYAFTTWLSSMNSVNPALLQFSINGINLGNTFNASSNSCDWNQFYSTWNSGTNSTATICIVNQNSLAAGNDFALDDIGFFELCTSVDSVTVTVTNISTNIFTQDTIRACGTSYVLDAGTGYASYQWNTGAQTQSINATTSGWYYCSISQGNCISKDSIFLSLVNANIINNDTSICSGANISLAIDSSFVGSGSLNGILQNHPELSLITTHNGHAYLLRNQMVSWTDAKAYGDALGLSMYVINNVIEEQAVYNALPWRGNDGKHYWLGLYQDLNDPNYSEPAGAWKWVDGTPLNYLHWAGGEPNDVDGGEHFGQFDWASYGSNWNDAGYPAVNGTHLSYPIYEFNNNFCNNFSWSTGATTYSINVAPIQSTTYYATTSNCISTCVDSVRVIVNSPGCTLHVSDTSFCRGDSAHLSANVSPSGNYNYSWQVPTGAQNPGNVSAFATIVPGQYIVVATPVSNLLCNSDFEDSQVAGPGGVTITNQNNIPCWKTTASDQQIEVWGSGVNGTPAYSGNQFIELNANMYSTLYQDFSGPSGTNLNISFAHRGRLGVDVMSVEIGPQGGPYTNLGTFSDDNTAWGYYTLNYILPLSTTGNYSLRFVSVNATGGNITFGNLLDAITIQNQLCPSFPDTANVTIYNPDTTNFTHIDCDTYNWHGNNYSSSGTYYYNLTNTFGCDSVLVLQLTLNNSTHNSITQTVCDSIRWNGMLYLNSGTHTYSYTNTNGCASVDTLHLTVNRSTHLSVTQTVCDSLRWNGILYQSSGVYLYNYINTAGCASVDTLHLTIKSSTHQSESHEVCRYFTWHETVYRNSGIYLYRYINSLGCPSVDTLHLTIHPGPVLGQDKSKKICYGTDFNLNSLFNLTAINVINWTLANNSVTDPTHANQAGNYQIIVGDIFGCEDTAMVNLSINPPVISNAGNDTIVQLNIPFQLHGSGGQTYSWSPAGVLNNPFIAAPWGNITGTTEFMLTTYDDIGCSDEDFVKVKALAGPQFYVPNAFSPNGDGLNDIFKPINVGIPFITKFCIYNRYGEKVFETSDLNKGWDGRFNGVDQPMFNYVWVVIGLDKNQKIIQKKGNVLLIR